MNAADFVVIQNINMTGLKTIKQASLMTEKQIKTKYESGREVEIRLLFQKNNTPRN